MEDKTEKEELEDALNKAKAYVIFIKSEAGKIFVDKLKEEAEAKINEIITVFKTATHIELMTLVVELETLRAFQERFANAKESVKAITDELKTLEK